MVADELSDVSALFNRKMEFHPARKQFTGFSNAGGNFRPQTLNPSSSNTQTHKHSPKNLKKADGSWVFENGMDPEISAIKFKRIWASHNFVGSRAQFWATEDCKCSIENELVKGAGLQNLGNTCFLNSVLQCLTYTEPLAAYLQSGKHQSSCRTAGFCALCAIQKHVSRALQSTGRILAPKEIVSNLRCISRSFRNSRQEDAHEYMVNLLESMHKCCLPSGVPSESPSAYDKSLVHKIFGGRLRSQVKCMQCSYSSNNYDPFLDLSLEIAKAESLNKALSHFTAIEQLDGGERQYQCQQCKQKVRAFKRLTIDKAPYVLTIHLKRFGSHFTGQKIDKKVLFGPTLDLEPFVTDPYDGDLKYTLYGVLVHTGWSTHSGHYYCFVRTSSGNWYSLDDNRVVQVSERKVLEQKAYMLFYYRNRRNFAPKKPLDVVQKQNMTTNAMGSIKAYSNLNQELKETIQSGRPVQMRLNRAMCAEDSLSAGVSAETLIKDSPGQNLNGSTTTESSAPNKDPLSESSPRVPPLEDPTEGLSVTSSQDGECLQQQDSSSVGVSEETLIKNSPGQNLSGLMTAECSTPNKDTPLEPSPQAPPLEDPMKGLSVKSHKDGECSHQDSFVAGSNVPLKLDSTMVTTSNAKLLECGPDRGAKEEVIDSGAISSNENEYKIPENALDESIAISPNGCIPQETPEVTKMTEKASPEESGCEASLLDPIGKTMEKIPPIILLSSASRENSQGEGEAISAKLSTLPIAKHMLIKKNVLEGKHSQRMRKKHPKCPIIKLHLSSKILLGTTLGVQKKKLKRSKKSTLGTTKTNLVQKHLVDGVHADSIPSNPGPSTSDDPLQKSSNSGSAGSQRDASRRNNSQDCKRDSMINSLMSMLTRGLEETIVPHWDDIRSTSCQTTEPRRVDIGYVGDEWDEEYDRGKKRKVRRNMKNDFSGPNLFQEFANTNPKLKKARMGLSSSGNKPYRI